METQLRTCNECGEEKALDSFPLNSSGKALRPKCRKCVADRANSSPAGILAQRRQHFKRYGITPEKYAEMLFAQGGVCKICKCPPGSGKRTVLEVDHDHKTGEVRGLLCASCNS